MVDLWAEVQVRTVLQDVWAKGSHQRIYRAEQDVPRPLRRRFATLAAVFELADRELDAILTEGVELIQQSRREIEATGGEVPVDVPSISAYIKDSDLVEHWASVVTDLDVSLDAPEAVGELVDLTRTFGITTIAELDSILAASAPWGDNFLRLFWKNTKRQWPNSSFGSNRFAIVEELIIANNLDRVDENILRAKFKWNEPWRLLDAAREATAE